mmetsp:Transcript_66174/g.183218  ORF Transcript_66174/g.183218 Transcript_66174/m.183218 type:complete len:146 (-) Transcript_66174:104-541(-)
MSVPWRLPALFMVACRSQAGYSPEELQRLAEFREQHRRTLDGRLCAAAFVQNRQSFTDCTAAPNPEGESGRPWCYVEPQLLGVSDVPAWGFCAPVTDYDEVRAAVQTEVVAAGARVKGYVAKLQMAQNAAADALDMFQRKCGGQV